MSVNILDLLKDQIGGQLAGNASKFLGESESGVSKALDGIFPSLLGSMVDQAGDDSMMSKLFDMAKGSNFDSLGDIGGLFSGGGSGASNAMNMGGTLLNLLMGNRTGAIIDLISKFAGLKGSTSSSLIKLAAPFLLRTIGKQITGGGLNLGGFKDLLLGQKSNVKAAMPSGLGSLGLFGGAADAAGDAARGAADAGKKVVGGTVDAGKKVVGGAADLVGGAADTTVKAGGSILKWLLPLLLLLGVLGFFGLRTGCDTIDNAASKTADMTEGAVKGTAGAVGDVAKGAAGAVGDAAGAVGDAAGDVAKGAADMVGGAFASVNEAGKKALDAVKFAGGSAGDQMMKYIDGGFKGDGKFTFKNLTFNTGSAAIGGTTGVEVDNLAAILKAYTDVKINVDGYTDNTGNADKNVQLSQARADAVKARLMAKGIGGDRIMTKGNGDANPVGDNSTKEGRAQNRRIEVTITK